MQFVARQREPNVLAYRVSEGGLPLKFLAGAYMEAMRQASCFIAIATSFRLTQQDTRRHLDIDHLATKEVGSGAGAAFLLQGDTLVDDLGDSKVSTRTAKPRSCRIIMLGVCLHWSILRGGAA